MVLLPGGEYYTRPLPPDALQTCVIVCPVQVKYCLLMINDLGSWRVQLHGLS